MQLELISFALCPFVHRAAIMLREKGVEFARRDIDLKNKPEWFLAISPRGMVPVLVADGVPLFESAAICEFFDETHAPRLLPDDPFARARERAWVAVASDLLAAQYRLFIAKTPEAVETATSSIGSMVARFEAALTSGQIDANGFGLATVATAPALFRFAVLEELTGTNVLAPWPRVDAWAHAIAGRTSVRSTVSAEFSALLRQMLAESDSEMLRAHAAV